MVGAEDPTKVVPQLQVGRRAGRERPGRTAAAAAAVLVEGADDVGAVAEVGREDPVEHLKDIHCEKPGQVALDLCGLKRNGYITVNFGSYDTATR